MAARLPLLPSELFKVNKTMRQFIACLILILIASPAAQRIVLKGQADVSSYITIINADDGTPETGVTHEHLGLDLEYVRVGTLPTDLTESTLAAMDTAHTDGGIKHVGGGRYRSRLARCCVCNWRERGLCPGNVYRHDCDWRNDSAYRHGSANSAASHSSRLRCQW